MPGGGDPVRGGVQAKDDRRGTLLPGASEGTGAVQGVRGGDGGGIIGSIHDDTALEIGRGNMDLENLGHRGRAADILHGLPCQGRSAELPSEEMPRTSSDKDGDASTFYSPACPGHRGHFGGGKQPPPTVPPVQISGPLAYTERKAPCHHRWELPGNYPVFTVLLEIYHYVERNCRILVTPNFVYNIYDNEKQYPGEPVNIHIQ